MTFTRKQYCFLHTFVEHDMILSMCGNTNFSGYLHLQDDQSEKSVLCHMIAVVSSGHQKSQKQINLGTRLEKMQCAKQ